MRRGAGGTEGRVEVGGDAAAPFRRVICPLNAITSGLPRTLLEEARGGDTCSPAGSSHGDVLPEAGGNPRGRSGKTLSH